MGIRGKLLVIFVLIKVLPLLLLSWIAWSAFERLGSTVSGRAAEMADGMVETIGEFAEEATDDAISALDDRSREALERLTTDTARAIASFLYDRDTEILQAALLRPSEAEYRRFMTYRKRAVFEHGPWRLKEDGSGWEAASSDGPNPFAAARAEEALEDNSRHFSSRPPEFVGRRSLRPLYVEMSFIDTAGRERIKIRNGALTEPGLRDVSDRRNTFLGGEDYWPRLQQLAAGDIDVSEVVGEYVGSRVIGPYTPAAAERAGIAFAPEESAYAGTENPVGRRFRGIVRWSTPVVEEGRIVGYVSLALDHDHLRQFTDRLSPTGMRYTAISDAISGNYAFMWDHKGRAISHPRDYFIVGFDRGSGERVVPWMDRALYDQWQASAKPANEFLAGVEPYLDQSLEKKPALPLLKAGTVALDCRYLNFSPQCAGWEQLTRSGGSGSFVIFFSGLWKLTTAAAIPYYTGRYGDSQRGFGFVTIGANVDEFHRAATMSATKIERALEDKRAEFAAQRADLFGAIRASLERTASDLGVSTALMIVAVIGVALWMAAFMTRQITRLSDAIGRFRAGELEHRIEVRSRDEMGQLANELNRMADAVEESFRRLDDARARAVEANQMKTSFLAKMSHELRTPLNGILGFAQLLEMRLEKPEFKKFASTIASSGRHLLKIVGDLLDMAKVEAGRVELEMAVVPARRFVEDTCAGHQAHAEEKGIGFTVELAADLPETITTDPLRLRQILNNLLNNAVKFTEKGRVSLAVEARESLLVFRIEDTGRGIPAEQLERVFEPFSQVEDFMNRSRDGTGLGLALARELAALFGGHIEVSSEIGVGSCFTLTVPTSSRVAQAA
ncbi:MAG: HAMP domain-containing protein [Rhodocyclaceae bacterium]|nr:HAMP domain-containing protein [Rhodocyclaceae bacterium]